MKLELKHLAPYLPYGLRIKRGERNLKMNTAQGSSTHWVGISAVISWQNSEMISKPFPILRPLSDLMKEIEIRGVICSPVDWLEEEYFTQDFRKDIIQLVDEPNWMNHQQYLLIQHLFEWHFDVFNLIEFGLAIDINSLSETTL